MDCKRNKERRHNKRTKSKTQTELNFEIIITTGFIMSAECRETESSPVLLGCNTKHCCGRGWYPATTQKNST
jgi:hypothetical protein